MAGNVWEWSADLYHEDYYKILAGLTTHNRQGPETSYDSNEPYALKRVSRGGSFLFHDSYYSGYLNSTRIKPLWIREVCILGLELWYLRSDSFIYFF